MTKKQDKKEVAVQDKNAGAMTNPSDNAPLIHAGSEMDADDFRIPKLTLIQAMTKAAFNTDSAAVGNFINSIEKMDMGNTFDVFVMTCTKLWRFNYEVKKGNEVKKEYLTIVDFKPYPKIREEMKEGRAVLPPEVMEKLQRNDVKVEQLLLPDLIYRFSVLLVDEVREKIAFPYMIDFTRSSASEGNKLKNIFFKMWKLAKLESFKKVFTISSDFVQAEHDYYVIKATGGRTTTDEETEAVTTWMRELQNNGVKYETSEDDVDSETDSNTVDVEAKPVDDTHQPKY